MPLDGQLPQLVHYHVLMGTVPAEGDDGRWQADLPDANSRKLECGHDVVHPEGLIVIMMQGMFACIRATPCVDVSAEAKLEVLGKGK